MEARNLTQQMNGDDCVAKPFDVKVLIDIINELLLKKKYPAS